MSSPNDRIMTPLHLPLNHNQPIGAALQSSSVPLGTPICTHCRADDVIKSSDVMKMWTLKFRAWFATFPACVANNQQTVKHNPRCETPCRVKNEETGRKLRAVKKIFRSKKTCEEHVRFVFKGNKYVVYFRVFIFRLFLYPINRWYNQ